MKIAAFMVVKNDVYYISMALDSVRPFVDGVYIQDQGSTDGTWEKIQDIIKENGENILAEQVITGLERFDPEYDEPYYRTMAVERCEEHFKPDWILKLDADEIYTQGFFRRLHNNDLLVPEHEVYAIRVSGDRFISTTRRTIHPSCIEISPEGVPFVDPHTQLWRAGRGVQYISNPAFKAFHPILSPDPSPQYWMPGICNIHIHRMFGPKAVKFWEEGGEKMSGPPYDPPTMTPKWYYSAINMGNSEKADFKFPDYVMNKWKEWGCW
uniref:Putative glycosyltransferase n=1 Tax=viral metagenome TaxID=1070528 RepID=A0A6M3KXI6_9ZZZZ